MSKTNWDCFEEPPPPPPINNVCEIENIILKILLKVESTEVFRTSHTSNQLLPVLCDIDVLQLTPVFCQTMGQLPTRPRQDVLV